IGLAALAREAKRQRILDRNAVPAVGDHLAAGHFVEQVRASPRRVLLLAGGEIGGAHHLLADLPPAALADPDAARGRAREGPAVGRILEPGLERLRLVGEPEAKV